MYVALALALGTIWSPKWCQLGERPTPLPVARVRGFLADLKSADPAVRRCALSNLDGVGDATRIKEFVDLQGLDPTQLEQELRLGMFVALRDVELGDDGRTVVSLLSLHGNGPAPAELDAVAHLIALGAEKRELGCLWAQNVGVAAKSLVPTLLREASPECLRALVAIDRHGEETRRFVATATTSTDRRLQSAALGQLLSLPRSAELEGLAFRALRQDCASEATFMASRDGRWLEALIDTVRGTRCPRPVRAAVFRYLQNSWQTAPAFRELVAESFESARWPDYREAVIEAFATSVLDSPTVFPTSWNAILTARGLSPDETDRLRKVAWRWSPAARAMLRTAASPALRKKLPPPPPSMLPLFRR